MAKQYNHFLVSKQFAILKNNNPVWKAFKEKWDNNIPRANSKKFTEYQSDAEIAQKELDRIADELQKEYAGIYTD